MERSRKEFVVENTERLNKRRTEEKAGRQRWKGEKQGEKRGKKPGSWTW